MNLMGSILLMLRPLMSYDYTVIQVVYWVELLEPKETLLNFCENMDPDKWDTTMWYRVIRNPQEFHGLTGYQRDPRIWGVTTLILLLL